MRASRRRDRFPQHNKESVFTCLFPKRFSTPSAPGRLSWPVISTHLFAGDVKARWPFSDLRYLMLYTPLDPSMSRLIQDATDPIETAHAEISNRDLLAELCEHIGCVVLNTFLSKPAHRKVTYVAWGAAYPTRENLDYQKHRELDLVLTTDRNIVSAIFSLQHLLSGKLNHFLQDVRVRPARLIVRRQPRARSPTIGPWAWRDYTLTSVCLARMMQENSLYLAEYPSHVHTYAPRHLEIAPFGQGYQVDLET